MSNRRGGAMDASGQGIGPMAPDALLGWFASGLVFAAFCARRMASLRMLAIASNFAFIGYGYADRLWPIIFLHAAMLPMNIVRLHQVIRESRSRVPAGRLSPDPAPPGAA